MPFYDNFIKSTQAPKDYWKAQMQALVDESFDNASTLQYDVEEEVAFGTLKFNHIVCRVNSIVDAKTGQRNNDDYKKIIFDDLTKEPILGTRYRFDNNIWIVFSTDNIMTDTAAVYVRRCNNTINTQDKYGKIHKEPCYIDYTINETQIYQEYTMNVPNGRIWVMCQNNKYTCDLQVNDRYVFNDNVYRVRERNRFDRQYTMEKDTATTISFYADLDGKKDSDRFDIDIADFFIPEYTIEVLDSYTNSIGYETYIKPVVKFKDVAVDEPIWFKSTNQSICTVDTYNGKMTFNNVGSCQIICYMVNNEYFNHKININVVESAPNLIVDKVEPDNRYMRVNQKQDYQIYSYLDGERLNTTFDIKAYDVPVNCFDLVTDGNNFTIHYQRIYEDGILRVVCINQDTGEETVIYIELGGVW